MSPRSAAKNSRRKRTTQAIARAGGKIAGQKTSRAKLFPRHRVSSRRPSSAPNRQTAGSPSTNAGASAREGPSTPTRTAESGAAPPPSTGPSHDPSCPSNTRLFRSTGESAPDLTPQSRFSAGAVCVSIVPDAPPVAGTGPTACCCAPPLAPCFPTPRSPSAPREPPRRCSPSMALSSVAGPDSTLPTPPPAKPPPFPP